jgi:hypothetical protein
MATTFNTGRGYTAQGQRIAFEVIETYREARGTTKGIEVTEDIASVVSFADVDRGIDGTVTIWDEPKPSAVLAAYDRGGYGFDEDRERVKRLYDAARDSQ